MKKWPRLPTTEHGSTIDKILSWDLYLFWVLNHWKVRNKDISVTVVGFQLKDYCRWEISGIWNFLWSIVISHHHFDKLRNDKVISDDFSISRSYSLLLPLPVPVIVNAVLSIITLKKFTIRFESTSTYLFITMCPY